MQRELQDNSASTGVERSEGIFNLLNFSIPLLMGIYVFVNPLPLSALSNVCFYLSVLSLLVLLGFKKTSFSLRSPLTLPFLLFSFWAVIGLLFTLDFENTLHDLRGHLLNYLIVFYLLVNYFSSQKRLEILSVLVISGATVSSLGTVISYYFIDGFPFSSRLGIDGNFRDMPCIYIGFITIPAIVLAFNRLQFSKTLTSTLLSVLAIAVLVSATLLTQSRGALFGLLAGLIVLCFGNRKLLIALISVLALALLVPGLVDRFDPERMINDERNKTNHLALEVFKLQPITGVGFGMQIYTNPNLVDLEKMNSQFPPEYRQAQVIAQPHNTVLDIAVRTGIVGLILYSSILFASFFMLWKTYTTTNNGYYRSWVFYLAGSYVSYLVPALFTDTTFGARAIIFYLMLAMITILWNLVRNEKALAVAPS